MAGGAFGLPLLLRVTVNQPGSSWRVEVADRSLVVEFDLSVVDRLGAEAIHAFGMVPRRGLEIGGILLGSVRIDTPLVYSIENFEIVPCDYCAGPVYNLEGLDRGRFAERIKALQTSDSASPKPLGYFRSHGHEEFELTPNDVELIQEFFPSQQPLALLIKPSAMGTSTAALFVPDESGFNERKPDHILPFRLRELTGDARPRPERPHHAQAHNVDATPPASAEHNRTEHQDREPSSERKWPRIAAWACLILSFALAISVLSYRFVGLRLATARQAPQADPYALGLQAEPSGQAAHLTWNRSLPAIQSAWRGVLTISEESASREVALDASQLRAGSILYRPKLPQVRFKLEVFLTEQRTLSETVTWQAPK